MSKGPFYGKRPHYTLGFSDIQGAFSIEAHLKELSAPEAQARGLDVAKKNLEIFCCNPREGNARIRHDMTATITPDFMGASGAVTIRGRPDSRLTAVTAKMGVKLYGPWEESVASASDGMEAWTRVRRIKTGTQPDTGAPIFDYPEDTVMLHLVKAAGDETSDTGATSATVMAKAGTLKVGDVLTRGDSYVVTSTPFLEGEFERAELSLRAY